MSTPTIPAGNLFMNATLYTGNGGTQTVSNGPAGASFTPDFIWIKNRTSGSEGQDWNDTVRGLNKQLYSNTTNQEYNSTDQITAFTSTGFTTGASGTTNANGNSLVAWMWKAGGTAVSNTAGSITSQVSANTTSGFSIVTYTGNGTIPSTIGHGLGVAPQFIIIKDRSVISNWVVQHNSLGWTQGFLGISTVAATSSSAFSNNTAPTSSVFTVGAYSNNNSENYVAYCWAPIAGYSQFGSYTGNGSTDGPFIYTGFRPRFVMIKSSSATGAWELFDTSRNTYNVAQNWLLANTSDAEVSGTLLIDILSNGFKFRDSGSDNNTNGATYIYAAFAEVPFKFANGR